MKSTVCLPIICVCTFCGCSDGEKTQDTGGFAALPDDAVIVKVNDNSLKKKDLLRFAAMEQRYAASKSAAERYELQQRIDEDIRNFVPSWIERTLLVDDAKRHRVLTEEEAGRLVDAMIDAAAKGRNMTREKFLESNKDDEWFIRETAATRVWINAHVASNIPPAVAVTPQMATNYVQLIEEETAAARATNDAIRARLEGIRAECLAGRESFTNVAAQISVEDWDLGEKERSEFDTAKLRNAVFALKEGMISPVMESDECYFAVYVAKVVPAEKDGKGRTVQPERRRVFQIALEKEGYPVKLTHEQALADLARQLQMQAVKNHVDDLRTNGQNRIEWPNGEDVLRRKAR